MKSCVSIVRCQNYDEGEVLERLRKAIDLLGGIEQFVQKGNRVLLKPNLLFGKAAEKAVTTHPSIVKGMIKIVREAGGIPFIGDSPSVGGLARTAEKAGIKRVADEMNCPVVEFDRPVVSPKGAGKHFKQEKKKQNIFASAVIKEVNELNYARFVKTVPLLIEALKMLLQKLKKQIGLKPENPFCSYRQRFKKVFKTQKY